MTTPLHNYSPAQLADMLGALDCEIKAAEARAKEIKDAITALGVDIAEGEMFRVSKVETVRQTMDTAAAKGALGDAWVLKHTRYTPVTSFRIAVKREALADAA